MGPTPKTQAVRDGFNLPVIVALELVEVEVGDPGVGCDSGPASLQILAAARCKVMPFPLKTSPLWTRSAVVAEGVKSATAPALAGGQRQGEPQTAEEKKAEKMGGICGVGTVWDCGEKVAGMWAGLGFHHCLAGRVDGVDDFISECNKACLAGWLLPAAGHGCAAAVVKSTQLGVASHASGVVQHSLSLLGRMGGHRLVAKSVLDGIGLVGRMVMDDSGSVDPRRPIGWDCRGRCGREAQPPHVQRQVGSGQSLGWKRSCVQQACSLMNACHIDFSTFPYHYLAVVFQT